MQQSWKNQLTREYERYADGIGLPPGICLVDYTFQDDPVCCIGVFHCYVPLPATSTALELIPLLEISVVSDFQQPKSYPYRPPIVRNTSGIEYLPPSLVDRQNKQLLLPCLQQWTPIYRINDVFTQLCSEIQQHDAQAKSTGIPSEIDGQVVVARKEVKDQLFSCKERVGTQGHTRQAFLAVIDTDLLIFDPFQPTHLLLRDTIDLKTLSSLSFKRDKSFTMSFKGPVASRTILTQDAEVIVRKIQQKFKQPEPTPTPVAVASKVTNKVYDKLEGLANSMSKFFWSSGQDEEDPLSGLLAMENDFFHKPSRLKVTQITNAYRAAVDQYEKTRHCDRILDALHRFVQHPQVQGMLGSNEAKYQDKGIRVSSREKR